MEDRDLRILAKYVAEELCKRNKEVMTTSECCEYLSISKNTLYGLTQRKEIPYCKPSGKLLFFLREDIDEWVRNGRVFTNDDIEWLARQR